jgi:hypothetical protein
VDEQGEDHRGNECGDAGEKHKPPGVVRLGLDQRHKNSFGGNFIIMVGAKITYFLFSFKTFSRNALVASRKFLLEQFCFFSKKMVI